MIPLIVGACGAAVVAWLGAYGYQRLRFAVLDREDAGQIEALREDRCESDWLSTVAAQAALGLVAPKTLETLKGMGRIDAGTVERASYGRGGYNPPLSSALPWLVLFALASAASVARGGFSFDVLSLDPPTLVFALALVAIAMADARFRIIPVPHLVLLFVSGLFAFGMGDPLAYVVVSCGAAALMWAASRMFELVSRQSSVCGLGDVLLVAVMAAALASAHALVPLGVFFAVLAIASVASVLWGLRGRAKNRIAVTSLRLPLAPAVAVAGVAATAFI